MEIIWVLHTNFLDYLVPSVLKNSGLVKEFFLGIVQKIQFDNEEKNPTLVSMTELKILKILPQYAMCLNTTCSSYMQK